MQKLTLSAIGLRLLLPLLLLELHVPVMHHSTGQLVDAQLFLCIKAQDVNGILWSEDRRWERCD